MNYELICIGASWGGLSAIEKLLTDIPPEVDPPIVIAQHRDAQKSALADVISRYTSRPSVDRRALRVGRGCLRASRDRRHPDGRE
jgi:chemotaxis response regulator CheB